MQKRARRWGLAVWLGATLAACGGSPSGPTTLTPLPPPSPQTDPATPPITLTISDLLAFGDSITEGFVSPAQGILLAVQPGNSYPAKLEALLQARFSAQHVRVANRGRGGETVAAGRARFQVFELTQPELVLLLEGFNDINLALFVASTTGQPASTDVVDEVVSQVRWMTRAAQVRGAAVLVATLTPVSDAFAQANADARSFLAAVNSRLRAMAASTGAGVVDLNAALSGGQLIGHDGIHPTVAGYERVAQAFFDVVVRQFQTAAVPTMAVER